MREHRSPAGAVLMIPEDWTPANGLVEVSDLQFSDDTHQRHFTIVSEKKDGLRNKSIERYSSFTRESIRQGLKFPESVGPRNFQIAGLPAIQYEINGSVAGEPFYYLHTIIEGEESFHQLVGWTHASRKEENWPLLHKITESFREK